MNLTKYKTLKNELLKKWDDEIFEGLTHRAYQVIKSNLDKNIIYEAGEKLDSYDSVYWISD